MYTISFMSVSSLDLQGMRACFFNYQYYIYTSNFEVHNIGNWKGKSVHTHDTCSTQCTPALYKSNWLLTDMKLWWTKVKLKITRLSIIIYMTVTLQQIQLDIARYASVQQLSILWLRKQSIITHSLFSLKSVFDTLNLFAWEKQ